MPGSLGATTAVLASVSWAYASARYARISRDVGSVRVNFARAAVAFPIFAVALALTRGGSAASGLTLPGSAWLFLSAVSSYAMADSVFFTAARRIGVTTALSIASMYPLWAALFGVFVSHEPFGTPRALGTVLAVSGIVWLVRLAGGSDPARAKKEKDWGGFGLAFAVSILWAANSVSVKHGARGLDLSQVNTVRYGIAVALLAPQLRGTKRSPASLRTWASALPAILADTVLGSICYVYGLEHTDLAVGATLTSLAPLISVPVAIALGEEDWSVPRFGAVVTTVSGIALLLTSGSG